MDKHINQKKDSLKFILKSIGVYTLMFVALTGCSEKNADSSTTVTTASSNGAATQVTTVTTAVTTTTTTGVTTPAVEVNDEAQALLATNPDTIGRIKIAGTNIDYPVAQSLDNSYYLITDFFGDYYRYGTVYADYRCNFGADEELHSDNIVLYGHHTALNDYFSQLHNYKRDIEFYKQYPIIELKSNYDTEYYKIFAYMITNASESDGPVFYYHRYHNFETQEDFDWYIDEVLKRSMIVSGVDVEYGDDILTLSTCTVEFEDSRFVVYARKLRNGEDEFAGVTDAYINPNPLMPDAYYRIYGGSYIENYSE